MPKLPPQLQAESRRSMMPLRKTPREDGTVAMLSKETCRYRSLPRERCPVCRCDRPHHACRRCASQCLARNFGLRNDHQICKSRISPYRKHRELKLALASYWAGKFGLTALLETARQLRADHWRLQLEKGIDIIRSEAFVIRSSPLVANAIAEYSGYWTGCDFIPTGNGVSPQLRPLPTNALSASFRNGIEDGN